MADIKFSPKQREVIKTRDKNILVSAAAGSGKTAVLVQRIIEKVLGKKVCNKELPEDEQNDTEYETIDIDKILVLTYTEAAAGEMRGRIEKRINEIAQSEDIRKNLTSAELENIARQAVLVHNAQISTIHGFCLSLIRNNFVEIGLDPSFRVAEPGEIKLVEGQVADKLIEDLFESDKVENFEKLADRFVKKNSFSNLKDTILNAYAECRNTPFVRDYMEERRNDYLCESSDDILKTAWGMALKEYVDGLLREAIRITEYNIDIAQGEGGPAEYTAALEKDIELIEGILESKTYDEYYKRFASISFEKLKNSKAPQKDYCQGIRKDVKGILTDECGKLFELPGDFIVKGMQENHIIINALVDVLLLLEAGIEEEKRSRKIIDFSDMEHYALKILLKKEDDKYVPTQVAKDYREAFKEIMVDEYQDSNHVQEQILKAISGEDEGKYNRFMVGDVKQSIYSFRNACPELFMDKYEQYKKGKKGCVRIDLSMNYRSRKEVLDSVNYIFERIMGADLGRIDYSEDARLNLGAKYEDNGCDNTAELMLIEFDSEQESKKQQQEAEMVAMRINELVHPTDGKPYMIQDKDVLRPCQYKDIVILLRSNKGWDDIFKQTLESRGIPTYIASKTGYFSATEIRNILNLLQVLDNPRNEIELFGTLISWFGKLGEDDIALIRSVSKQELYESIIQLADGSFEKSEEISDEIKEKCQRFVMFISKYREKVVYTPINELLEEIIIDTGYLYHISSLPFGEQRRANVFMLIEKAKQYESGSFKGLYHFIRYINEIQSYEVDYGEASILDENSDVVRIMSIHKSKGLEFPVCFVCGMDKSFNFMDTSAAMVFEKNYGVAIDYVNLDKNVRYKDLRHSFLGKCMKADIVAEEIRVLYVAMTRAKEKLIMTSCVKELEKRREDARKYAELTLNGGTLLSKYNRSKCDSYLDFVLKSIDEEDDSVIKVRECSLDEIKAQQNSEYVERGIRRQQLVGELSNISAAGMQEELSREEQNNIKNKIVFKYLHSNLADLYTKTSVSELKMAAIHNLPLQGELEDESHEIFSENADEAYVPKFAHIEEKIKGTTRGSAYHRLMELYDFAGTIDFENLDSNSQENKVTDVIDDIVEKRLVDRETAELVDIKKIVAFVKSDLGRRMCEAARRNELYLEEPFVLGINADRLDSEFPSDEMVLIQGIIDAFFIENGKIILMDYKTDNVKKPEELVERYKVQLDYYKEALERIKGMEVAETLIYSFAFGETIEVL